MAAQTYDVVCVSNMQELYVPLSSNSKSKASEAQKFVDYKPFFWCLDQSRLIWLSGKEPVFSPAFEKIIFGSNVAIGIRRMRSNTSSNNLTSRSGEGLVPEIYSTVHSKVIFELKQKLDSRKLDGGNIRCPRAEEVAHINTRVGGYEWLSEIDTISSMLPASITMFGLAQAEAFVRNHDEKTVWYVKSNVGVGGFGVWRLEPGEGIEVSQEVFSDDHSKGKKKAYNWMTQQEFVSQPYLVQKSMEDSKWSELNSITADFSVFESNGEHFCCELVGYGFQKFDMENRYCGVKFRSGELEYSLIENIRYCGKEVAKALHRIGYSGFFNLDFSYSQDRNTLYLLELNLRSSAPLDQFLLLRALRGKDWFLQAGIDFEFSEADPLPSNWNELWSNLETDRLFGKVPVHKPINDAKTWPVYQFNENLSI